MSRGSANFLIFFVIVLVLGAILAVGANELHHGFLNGSFFSKGLDSARSSFYDSRTSTRDNPSEVPLARIGHVNDPEPRKKINRPVTKLDKATLEKHKDELEHRDRAELDDLIDKVGK